MTEPLDRERADLVVLDGAVDQCVARLKFEAPGVAVACDRCTDPACCEDVVLITPGEAALLAAGVRRRGRGVLRRVRRRIDDWRRSDLPELAQRVFDAAAEGAKDLGAERAYRKRALPCPLLEERRCLAYTDRPRPCRMLVALGEPSSCRAFGRGEVGQLASIGYAAIGVAEVKAGGRAAVMRNGETPKAPLPVALELALLDGDR